MLTKKNSETSLFIWPSISTVHPVFWCFIDNPVIRISTIEYPQLIL